MILVESRIGLKPLASLFPATGDFVRRRGSMCGPSGSARQHRHTDRADDALPRSAMRIAQGTTISDALDQTGSCLRNSFATWCAVRRRERAFARGVSPIVRTLRAPVAAGAGICLSSLHLAADRVGTAGARSDWPVIWLMGVIPVIGESGIDMLGLGLRGNSGLLRLLLFFGSRGRHCFVVYRATVRGLLWVAPIQRMLMQERLGRRWKRWPWPA